MHGGPHPGREVLDFRPGADMRWELVPADDAFQTITTVGAGTGGPPVHLHPGAEERYEVLDGGLEVLVGGTWRTLGPGEEAVVPPGTPHTVRALPGTGARVVNTHRPALEYEEFFRHLHRLVRTGAMTMPPKDPKSLLYFGLLFSTYPHLQRSVKPPQGVFRVLGRIARLAGLRLDG